MRKPVVALIDFGQVGHLDGTRHWQVMRFVNVLTNTEGTKRVARIANVLKGLHRGELPSDFAIGELSQRVSRVMEKWSLDTDDSAEMISELYSAAEGSGVSIDLPYWQLLKGFASIEATMQAVQQPEGQGEISVEVTPSDIPEPPGVKTRLKSIRTSTRAAALSFSASSRLMMPSQAFRKIT
jgi:hypothetical protein